MSLNSFINVSRAPNIIFAVLQALQYIDKHSYYFERVTPHCGATSSLVPLSGIPLNYRRSYSSK